ncbi:MAG: putative 4-mercaptohistidine N1-methyltransferase [Opitutales bacterium]
MLPALSALPLLAVTPAAYESERILHEYLLFHYGEPAQLLPWDMGPTSALNFPRRCVEETFEPTALPSEARILDLGCAVGRSTFELSRYGAEVIGIDYSRAFINAAQALAAGQRVPYAIKQSGHTYESAEAVVPAGCHPQRVTFEVGDAHDLRSDLGDFDLVLACNLLCRLHTPQRLLERLASLVRPGGQLVLTTPHTWMEEFTESSRWLAPADGESPPLGPLTAALAPAFSLVRHRDMPFLIREHRRKFQWSVAEATIWRRGRI